MPRVPAMHTPRRRSPPRCPHTAKAQPTSEDTRRPPLTTTRVGEWIRLADAAAIVPPDVVEQKLLPECDGADDVARLRALLPQNVPTMVLLVPAAGTFFPAEFCTLTGMLTVWFPSCHGDPPVLWEEPFSGHHAATHLFLRFRQLFDRAAVEKNFVAARPGAAPKACCKEMCAVNWCQGCVAAWAVGKVAGLANIPAP